MRLHLAHMDIGMIERDLNDTNANAIDAFFDGEQHLIGIGDDLPDHGIGQNALLHRNRQPVAMRMPDDRPRQELGRDRVVRVQRDRVRHAADVDAVGGELDCDCAHRDTMRVGVESENPGEPEPSRAATDDIAVFGRPRAVGFQPTPAKRLDVSIGGSGMEIRTLDALAALAQSD